MSDNIMESPKGKSKKQLRMQVRALQTACTNQTKASIKQGERIRFLERELERIIRKLKYLENTTIWSLVHTKDYKEDE